MRLPTVVIPSMFKLETVPEIVHGIWSIEAGSIMQDFPDEWRGADRPPSWNNVVEK